MPVPASKTVVKRVTNGIVKKYLVGKITHEEMHREIAKARVSLGHSEGKRKKGFNVNPKKRKKKSHKKTRSISVIGTLARKNPYKRYWKDTSRGGQPKLDMFHVEFKRQETDPHWKFVAEFSTLGYAKSYARALARQKKFIVRVTKGPNRTV